MDFRGVKLSRIASDVATPVNQLNFAGLNFCGKSTKAVKMSPL